jgi:hypothetical protein
MNVSLSFPHVLDQIDVSFGSVAWRRASTTIARIVAVLIDVCTHKRRCGHHINAWTMSESTSIHPIQPMP